MTDLSNMLPSLGRRVPFQIDVDEDGVLVKDANEKRKVIVLFNVGADTAWASNTLETATPEEGFPILPNGGLIEDASYDAWYVRTATGETADIRGWEVERP